MDNKVKIYTTPTCTYCTKAKEFLTQKGVEFESVDVTKDKEALKEMKEISGGARSVPVISVCGKVMVGFDPSALEDAIKCLQ